MMFDFMPDWEWLNFLKGVGPQPYDGLLGGTSSAPAMSPAPGMVAQASPMPVQNRPQTMIEQMGIGQPSAADRLGVAQPVAATPLAETAQSRSEAPPSMDPAMLMRMQGLLAPMTRRDEEQVRPISMSAPGLARMQQLAQLGLLPGAQMRRR